MKNWLTNATKTRVIGELRKILLSHPLYADSAKDVRNKFSFPERPNRGVIVNSTSADRVKLSSDNYVGRIKSFCMLTWFQNFPGTSIEWVTENKTVLESVDPTRSVFPAHPGVYLIEIKSVPDLAKDIPGEFEVEVIKTVFDEYLLVFGSDNDLFASLSNTGVYEGSLSLWLDGKIKLIEGSDYSFDIDKNEIVFLLPTISGSYVVADYRYSDGIKTAYPFKANESNISAIPGATIAFGERCVVGDKQAVVVTDQRVETADVYGGKFEINFELIAFTRDSEDREKFSDYIVVKFLELQNQLGFEGLELLEITPAGESEESFNDTSDEYWYDSSISLSLRVDWETYSPLPISLSYITLSTPEQEKIGRMNKDVKTSINAVVNPEVIPVAIGRELTFERL